MRDDTPSSGSEPRLHRLVFEHSSDAIAVVDDEGRVLMSNRAARELAGVDVQRLFVWSPQRDPDLTAFRAQLRVGGRASCELRVGSGRAARHLALEGRAHGPHYVVVLRDVTEQRRQQQELRHLRQLESIGLLTASVVHDFNNVLTAIVCASSLLTQEVAGQDRAQELAHDVRSAAERATGLIRQVMSILRREPGKPERINLTSAVTELRPLVELVAGRAVEIVTELDPALPDATVDREQLDQVLLNLVANGRDAMPAGGKLTIATANVTLDDASAGAVTCAVGGAYVLLTVTDTGEGMVPEVRERIFERFFTARDAGRGTGLGLAGAQRFVNESGGCITVRSAPGQGTTIAVYLPQSGRAGNAAPRKPAKVDAPLGGTETIVVIEPDDHVRGAVRSVLQDRGYRVIDAPTGALALRQAQLSTAPVRLVLADACTRSTDGPEVLQRLRRSGHPATMLLVSGATDEWIAELGLDEHPMLRKVFSPDQLARRVRETLDAPRITSGRRP